MTWLWILIAFMAGGVFGMLMGAVLIANGDDGPVRGDGFRDLDQEMEAEHNENRQRKNP